MDEIEESILGMIQTQLNGLYVSNNMARSVLGPIPALAVADRYIKNIRQHLITLGIDADWS